jgi:GT2 family glycosyltransferase
MSKHRSQPKPDGALVDIVIPIHSRFDLLEQCLQSIPDAAVDITYNLILVDNKSPDPGDFWDRWSRDAIILHNKENLGFPKACNQGVRRKTSPLILLLNSDVILYPGAIHRMVKAMDDPKVGVVGAKLLFPTEEQISAAKLDPRIRPAGKVQHVGLETNIRAEFYHIFLGWSEDHPKVNRMRETYAVTGACLMTRRSIWNRIGGLFEGYGQGTYEDLDFCLTTRDIGYSVIVETQAVGVHFVGATSEAYRKPMPMNENRMIFMQRWGNRLNYTESERL